MINKKEKIFFIKYAMFYVLFLLFLFMSASCLNFFNHKNMDVRIYKNFEKDFEDTLEIMSSDVFGRLYFKLTGEIQGSVDIYIYNPMNFKDGKMILIDKFTVSEKVNLEKRYNDFYDFLGIIRFIPHGQNVTGKLTLSFYRGKGFNDNKKGSLALIPSSPDYLIQNFRYKSLTVKELYGNNFIATQLSEYKNIKSLPSSFKLIFQYHKKKNYIERDTFLLDLNNEKKIYTTDMFYPRKENIYDQRLKILYQSVYLTDMRRNYLFLRDENDAIYFIKPFDSRHGITYRCFIDDSGKSINYIWYTSNGLRYEVVFTKHDMFGNWIEMEIYDIYNKLRCKLIRIIEYD